MAFVDRLGGVTWKKIASFTRENYYCWCRVCIIRRDGEVSTFDARFQSPTPTC
ncbi:MAG: hypothetical protein ACLSHM_01505 [Vescimonas sp.]